MGRRQVLKTAFGGPAGTYKGTHVMVTSGPCSVGTGTRQGHTQAIPCLPTCVPLHHLLTVPHPATHPLSHRCSVTPAGQNGPLRSPCSFPRGFSTLLGLPGVLHPQTPEALEEVRTPACRTSRELTALPGQRGKEEEEDAQRGHQPPHQGPRGRPLLGTR